MKMKQWSLAVTICALIMLLPTITVTAKATDHTHPDCGTTCADSPAHEAVEWVGVDDLNNELEPGNYYLTEDVTISTTWEPQDGIALDLNGFTITVQQGSVIKVNSNVTFTLTDCQDTGELTGSYYRLSSNGGGVSVSQNGTFRMYGGTITGNPGGTYGGGVYVDGGTFLMAGGSIYKNYAQYGAGVYVADGTFTMSGGSITENVARESSEDSEACSSGGGVYIAQGTFTMSKGDITGNTVTATATASTNSARVNCKAYGYGGGVYLANGTFTISGGSIAENTVSSTSDHAASVSSGGGVQVADGRLILCGGAITDNTVSAVVSETSGQSVGSNYGGGVYVSSEGTLQAYGGPQVNENLANNKMDNVYLSKDKTVEVTGVLTTGASIGVTLSSDASSLTFTSGWNTKGNSNTNVFLTDDPWSYQVAATSDGADVTLETATHTFVNDTCRDCGAHRHTVGENKDVVFLPTATLPKAEGRYVLTGDVEISSPWEPKGSTFLDLDGHSITLTGSGRVIQVAGIFTLSDCNSSNQTHYGQWNESTYNITSELPTSGTYDTLVGGLITRNGSSNWIGTGVWVRNGGEFDLYGGNISGNNGTAYDVFGEKAGGGVWVSSTGIFNMYGGSITGNISRGESQNFGGGIYIYKGTFAMFGGTIANNLATSGQSYGGGVYIKSGSFTMSGGTISGNSMGSVSESNNYGGGVYITGDCVFTMSGGTISDNTVGSYDNDKCGGGGIYVAEESIFRLSGTPTITGNSVRARDRSTIMGNPVIASENNVELASGKTIQVTGALTGASIGVTVNSDALDTAFTDGWSTSGNADISVFSADNSSTAVKADESGELVMEQRTSGDINGDGKVDTNDLVRLMKKISENAQDKNLDINGDGKVDTNDLIRLMKYLTDSTVEIH
jgi:hypothetical protein